jgi:hypothetical protein
MKEGNFIKQDFLPYEITILIKNIKLFIILIYKNCDENLLKYRIGN